ncbi:hypothetical protein BDB00DRAFT_837928 [Zychaea mexicana]|uniref:uncharacterized protein n=1 Tax=Zychaea mexicana TaxID=64656 RepID=UPI0022FE6CA8|nr:uncharacterized protein BDB00DRAFT_837928 [Zychaea mexicana]KAI9490467.1 hypothetical protein BDB00DRAFT_837928 [Zychaea mexicana]
MALYNTHQSSIQQHSPLCIYETTEIAFSVNNLKKSIPHPTPSLVARYQNNGIFI